MYIVIRSLRARYYIVKPPEPSVVWIVSEVVPDTTQQLVSSAKCRLPTTTRGEVISGYGVGEDDPRSSTPDTSTNSRLLGLSPTDATRDVDRSANDGTGQAHRITFVPDTAALSRRSINVARIEYIVLYR